MEIIMKKVHDTYVACTRAIFLPKKGRIGAGMIKSAIIGIIFLTVFLSILPSLIVESAESVYDLSQNYTDLSTEIGSGASDLGGNIDEWTGYFWVIGPLILIITIISGIFMRRR